MITKPSLSRLARRAGVKSLSEDCYKEINNFIVETLSKVLKTVLIVNSERNTKTIMPDDIYDSLSLNGYNFTTSNVLSTASLHQVI